MQLGHSEATVNHRRLENFTPDSLRQSRCTLARMHTDNQLRLQSASSVRVGMCARAHARARARAPVVYFCPFTEPHLYTVWVSQSWTTLDPRNSMLNSF